MEAQRVASQLKLTIGCWGVDGGAQCHPRLDQLLHHSHDLHSNLGEEQITHPRHTRQEQQQQVHRKGSPHWMYTSPGQLWAHP